MSRSAFEAAASKLGINAHWFVLCPASEPLPHYVLLVEPGHSDVKNELKSLASEFDRQLSLCNTEYESKRLSQRLAPPCVWVAAAGSYALWRQYKINDGANDDQIKPIHLVRDTEFADRFTIVERYNAC